jgi:hypothetical protein
MTGNIKRVPADEETLAQIRAFDNSPGIIEKEGKWKKP